MAPLSQYVLVFVCVHRQKIGFITKIRTYEFSNIWNTCVVLASNKIPQCKIFVIFDVIKMKSKLLCSLRIIKLLYCGTFMFVLT